MEKRTYYMILGVSHTESPSGIRAAYRDRARRLHPDVAGDGATSAFQELTEAYGVLSDPERRLAYNASLEAAPPREPAPLFAHPETIRPSAEALYERWLRNFTGISIPKAE